MVRHFLELGWVRVGAEVRWWSYSAPVAPVDDHTRRPLPPLPHILRSASPPPGEKRWGFDEAMVVFVAKQKRHIEATVVFVANQSRLIEASSLLPNGGGAERRLRSGGGTGEAIVVFVANQSRLIEAREYNPIPPGLAVDSIFTVPNLLPGPTPGEDMSCSILCPGFNGDLRW